MTGAPAAGLAHAVLANAVLAKGAGSAAGPLGLVVVLLLGVATVLLIRNMDKRLRRLPRDFGPVEPRAAGPATRGPGTAGPGAAAPGPDGATPAADLPAPRRGPDDRPDRPA